MRIPGIALEGTRGRSHPGVTVMAAAAAAAYVEASYN